MTTDPTSPETLVSLGSETEATAIVGALAEHGITAMVVGGLTASFRAEAPGEARVVVGQADMARARQVLAAVRGEPAEIDWSTVDCGDRSAPDEEERAVDTETDQTSTPQKLQPYQFSIAFLLALQALVSLLLGLWQGIGAGLLCAAALFGATLLLILASTVAFASDLNRGRQIWVRVGPLLLAATAVVALLTLISRVLGDL